MSSNRGEPETELRLCDEGLQVCYDEVDNSSQGVHSQLFKDQLRCSGKSSCAHRQ